MPKEVPLTFTHRDEDLPDPGRRVIGYSPSYEGGDQAMLYRFLDSQFVRISSDVEYWAYADQISMHLT